MPFCVQTCKCMIYYVVHKTKHPFQNIHSFQCACSSYSRWHMQKCNGRHGLGCKVGLLYKGPHGNVDLVKCMQLVGDL